MATKQLERPMHFEELKEFLGMGSDYLYKRLQSGEIPGRKLGNKWIVYPSDLRRFLDGQYSNQKRIKRR